MLHYVHMATTLPSRAGLLPSTNACRVPASGRSLRILHLDDDRCLSAGVARLLRRDGHRVLSVTSPQLAIFLLRGGSFDLVLSDYNVDSYLTGADVLAAAGQTPFIFLSSDALCADRGVEWLEKPATWEQLRAAIARVEVSL